MRTRSMSRIIALGVVLGLAPFALAQGTYPGPYTLTRIDCPGATATDWSFALGINSEGQVVGWCKVGAKFPSFVLNEGSFTWVEIPGKDMTHAWGINARGDVVGTYHNFGQPQRGFLVSEGNVTWIDFPAALETFPKGVNLRGEVVGFYTDGAKVAHAFLWSGGGFTTIDPPGATRAAAMGINSRGDIAGWYNDAANKRHGYLLRKGVPPFTTIDISGATETTVSGGPNPQGDVAGYYVDSSGWHSFVLRAAGALITFDGVPGAPWSMIHGLNAAGEVVGHYPGPDGNQHGWGLLLPRR